MKNSVIIIAIIVIVVVVVGALAYLNVFTAPANGDNKTQVTANGTKITVINNNQDVWAHWKLQLQNAPQKNGTTQTYYVDTYVKPGENVTFDMSNMLGYENTPLPPNTNITVLGWGGVYNSTASGESKFDTSFLLWTTDQTKQSNNTLDIDPPQAIGALPGNVTDNSVNVGTIDPGSNPNDLLFVQFNVVIGPNGELILELSGTPTLCNVIAQT